MSDRTAIGLAVALLSLAAAIAVFAGPEAAGEVEAQRTCPPAEFTQAAFAPCAWDELPIAEILRAPAVVRPADEVRADLPDWLRLPALPTPAIRGATLDAATDPPGDTRLLADDSGAIVRGQSLLTLDTTLGTVTAVVLRPESEAHPARVLVLQHGHEGLAVAWRDLGWVAEAARAKGWTVVLPIQPAATPAADHTASMRLHLLGRSMMGVRVAVDRLVLDWIGSDLGVTHVSFVGHSMGSVVGFLLSSLDPRVRRIAVDHVLTGPYVSRCHVFHCEAIPGLFELARADGTLRADLPLAGTLHVQAYRYPDRTALLDYTLAD